MASACFEADWLTSACSRRRRRYALVNIAFQAYNIIGGAAFGPYLLGVVSLLLIGAVNFFFMVRSL